MLRTMFAIAITGLIFASGSGTTQAAPILPLPAAATASFENLTDVQRGDAAGVTAGDVCAAALVGLVGALAGDLVGAAAGVLAGVPGALALAGVVAGVATAGVTRGAGCVAGGDCILT